MFNLGGDDKEKLKQNMEEIKKLVESDQGSSTENTSEQDLQPPKEQETEQIPSNNLEQDTEIKDSIQTHEQKAEPQPAQQNTEQKQVQNQNLQQETKPSSDFKKDLNSISNEVRGLKHSKEPAPRNPTPPTGNTLFLEVDEFNQVKEMVEEMRYLSREVEDLMSHLEKGIEDSRRFESEVSQVLNEFSDRRKRINSSIN